MRLCHCLRSETDPFVKGNLAVTPSKAYEASLLGVPISCSTLPLISEGDRSSSMNIDPLRTRNYGLVDAWNDSKTAERSIKRRFKQSKKDD